MSAKIVDGRKIAGEIKNRVSEDVKSLVSKYKLVPNIVTVKIGSDSSSELYLKLRDKACEEVGINSSHVDFLEEVSEEEVLEKILCLNDDSGVHGILIQFPVPSHISQNHLMEFVDSEKDVEGFNPFNMGRTLLGDESVVPCTSLAVLKILEYEKMVLKGKDVVVVNHSNVVGKPLTALLLNRDATVCVCHVFTKDLKKYCLNADVVVSAAGVKGLIKEDMVKPGCFVVDVGIISTESGVCGDVDFENVKKVAGFITPVPGGVGPVTIACSLENMIQTFRNCVEE